MSYEYEEINSEIYFKFRKYWNTSDDTRYVKVKPKIIPSNIPIHLKGNTTCTLPHQYESIAEKIKNFEVREDDVWIITYPRSGTTWTQEMVWLLKNNLDFESAKNTYLSYRAPFFEFNCIGEFIDIIEHLQKMPSPRCIKTHLPIQFLPDQIWVKRPKMIYVKRNFKDMVVSYCHLYEGYRRYSGTMEDFNNAFMGDYVEFSPHFPHIKNYCDASKVLENLIVLNYEDMKTDLKVVIQQVTSFLELPALKEADLTKLCEHLSIGNMKKNSAVNPDERPKSSTVAKKIVNIQNDNLSFIRRGKVEGWKDEISNEQSLKLDKWLEMEAKKY